MNGSDLTLVIILVVVFGGPLFVYVLYKSILYWMFNSRQNRTQQQYLPTQQGQTQGLTSSSQKVIPPLEDRKAAFSVGGNLVREVNNVPITDVYQVSKTLLGRGSSAEVIIGEHMKNRRRYAIKIIDNTRKEVMWRYDREKNFLRDIDHTNVVRLYEVYTYKQSMYFVMELCTGGHLGQALQHVPKNAFPEEKARNYVLQILRALVHCHERGICHRDIKLQNILMENHSVDAQVKVIDFGNAVRYRGQTPLTKVVGTTYTAAPEVFRKHYDERCDVWSLGVVTYILLSGRRPFERVEIAQNVKSKESSVIASILMGRYHFRHEIWQTISTDAIGFVQACLEMDFTKRSYPVELLNHPWIAKNRQPLSGNGLAAYSTFARNTMLNLTSTLSASAMLGTTTSNGATSPLTPGSRGLIGSGVGGMESQLSSPHLVLSREGGSNVGTGVGGSSKAQSVVSGGGGGGDLLHGGNLFGLSSNPPESPQGVGTGVGSVGVGLTQPFQSTIRQTSMLAVAFAMPISRARQLRDLFQQIDNNNNGTIDREEFHVAFTQFHPEMTTNDIDLLFDVIDQDDNKAISFLEFVAATIDPREVDIREINQAFRILDKDQKGYLTKQDLLRVLSTVPPEESSANNSTGPQRHSSLNSSLNNSTNVSQHRSSNHVNNSSVHSNSGTGTGTGTGTGGVNTRSSLNGEEGNKAVQEAIRLQRIQEKVEHILKVADMNRDGVISYTEFIFSMAEGSMQLFEGIDVNPEKLAQAPPVVQRPSFISRTMGIGSRSSLEEAQTLMRQLSSKRYLTEQQQQQQQGGGPFGGTTQRNPSIQGLPRQQSSFLASILPSNLFQGLSSSKLGVGSSKGGSRHTKYGEFQPQDPSVLLDRKGFQPADSIEDSSLQDMEQGQGQGQGQGRVNLAMVAPAPIAPASAASPSAAPVVVPARVASASPPPSAVASAGRVASTSSPVVALASSASSSSSSIMATKNGPPKYTVVVATSTDANTGDVVPTPSRVATTVAVNDNADNLVCSSVDSLSAPVNVAPRTRVMPKTLSNTSIAAIVPIDSMDSIDGVLRGSDRLISSPPLSPPSRTNSNLAALRSKDQFEDGSAIACSGSGAGSRHGGDMSMDGTSTKKFLQKQGTFANICIEEEDDWMCGIHVGVVDGVGVEGTTNGALIDGGGLMLDSVPGSTTFATVGVSATAVGSSSGGTVPSLLFDSMQGTVGGVRRNSITQATATTTNDNSSRISSSRTSTVVRNYQQQAGSGEYNGENCLFYGNDNSEGSISTVVQVTGQWSSTITSTNTNMNTTSSSCNNTVNLFNNDDLEYDRRQQQYFASSDLSSSTLLSSSALNNHRKGVPSTSMLIMSMMTPMTGGGTLDAVPEAPGDGSKSMLEEQSSLISNDPRLHHLLVTQDIEN